MRVQGSKRVRVWGFGGFEFGVWGSRRGYGLGCTDKVQHLQSPDAHTHLLGVRSRGTAPPHRAHLRAVGIGLLYFPRGIRLFMSE